MRHLYEGDSWVVLSPMRTGSFFLTHAIDQSYKSKGISLKWFSPSDSARPIEISEIWHYHHYGILQYLHPETQLVLSTRDPVEAALSFLKAEQYGHWHLMRVNAKLIYNVTHRTPSYVINCEKLKSKIDEMCDWYESFIGFTANILPYIFIDYKEFEDGNLSGVYKKLDIPTPNTICDGILKTPGTNEQWITNWDEVQEFLENYDRSRILSLPYFSN